MPQFAINLVMSIFLLAAPQAPSQQPTETAAPSTISIPTYPDSTDGLKKLLDDIFAAMQSGNEEKASRYFSALAIPDHEAWFLKTFGPTEGPRLEAKYLQLLPQAPAHLKDVFAYALKGQRTDVRISLLQQTETTAGPWLTVLEDLAQPTQIYVADGTGPKDQFATAIGDFVYVDGGFRYLNSQLFQAFSNARPMRVRIGGNVQGAKVIRKVVPAYPAGVKPSRGGDAVLLHVVLGVDGTPKEVTLQSGDPIFGQAAIDAVRQWRYQPTTLNGTPVEVDTIVRIEFRK